MYDLKIDIYFFVYIFITSSINISVPVLTFSIRTYVLDILIYKLSFLFELSLRTRKSRSERILSNAVSAEAKCNSCILAIVFIDLRFRALSWLRSTLFFVVRDLFLRFPPPNTPVGPRSGWYSLWGLFKVVNDIYDIKI